MGASYNARKEGLSLQCLEKGHVDMWAGGARARSSNPEICFTTKRQKNKLKL